MMFMIPTPPTTSEISATHSSRLVIRRWVVDRDSLISAIVRMMKSSGWPARRWWRSRSSSEICWTASSICGVEIAAAMIWSMLEKRTASVELPDCGG